MRAFRHTGKRATQGCPCGWRASGKRDCRCDDGAIARYAARISGPLLDRIDLQVAVQPVAWRELDAGPAGPSSREVGARVLEHLSAVTFNRLFALILLGLAARMFFQK